MNIDNLKNEFKKLRAQKMDISLRNTATMDDFIQTIRKQDRDDERYILKKKVLPLGIGLFLFTITIMIYPIRNVILLTGCIFVFVGLISTLILFILDYKNITRETFDFSLLTFLKHKQARFSSWKTTPARYNIAYAIFIVGLVMMIVGNTNVFLKDLKTTQNVIIFIGVYLFLLLISWAIGEYFYRKRHKEKHQPLLKVISELTQDLEENNK